MSLFGKKEKEENALLQEENAQLKQEVETLRNQLTPEQKELSTVLDRLNKARTQLFNVGEAVKKANARLFLLKEQIVETDEAILLQSFGFYTPHYSYTTSDEYKKQLKENRERQKAQIKNGQAVIGSEDWTLSGSHAQGIKMIRDTKKLLLRAFNAECDDAVEHVRFSNIEASKKKINASADAISKLGALMRISISPQYVELKLEELALMHEYQVKKQEEKEQAKEARARQREEAKALKEMEEAKKKLEKEQNHYSNELSRLNTQIAAAKSEEERTALEEKKKEITSRLEEIDKQIADVDYRAANQRAGYVYVISNIGAFGENIFRVYPKIRHLEEIVL